MKKKDKIITVLCLLWIGLVLYLKFNGEYTIQPVTDIEWLAEECYQNWLLEYLIDEYRNEAFGDDMEDWVNGQGEKAYLLILKDGSVYFWNMSRYILGRLPDETYEDITRSAYYMGHLSTLDLWFLRWNAERVDPYKGYDNGDGPWGNVIISPDIEKSYSSDNGNDNSIIDNEEINIYEIRQQKYDCTLHNIHPSFSRFAIENNGIFSENNRRSNDINAILILNWLRTTWHYQQYIDLMYQEMYPWLVE